MTVKKFCMHSNFDIVPIVTLSACFMINIISSALSISGTV